MQYNSNRLLALLGSDILVALKHLFNLPSLEMGYQAHVRIAHLSSDLEVMMCQTLRIMIKSVIKAFPPLYFLQDGYW